MHDSRLRMASLWPLGLKVVVRLLHLWLSLVTFMVVQVITFMGKFYYICGWWIYYICGLKFLHLWLVLHLLSIFITFMVGITFMVFITFMGDTRDMP